MVRLGIALGILLVLVGCGGPEPDHRAPANRSANPSSTTDADAPTKPPRAIATH